MFEIGAQNLGSMQKALHCGSRVLRLRGERRQQNSGIIFGAGSGPGGTIAPKFSAGERPGPGTRQDRRRDGCAAHHHLSRLPSISMPASLPSRWRWPVAIQWASREPRGRLISILPCTYLMNSINGYCVLPALDEPGQPTATVPVPCVAFVPLAGRLCPV